MPGIAGNYSGVIFLILWLNDKIAVDLPNGVQAAIKTQQIIILYLVEWGCAGLLLWLHGIPDCTISAEKDFDDGVKEIVG